MSSRQSTDTRLHCTVSGCRVSVGRKADLVRHQEEKHGETKFCPVPGCDYEGTKRSARLKSHIEKRHPGTTSVELYVPENEASGSQYVEEGEQAEKSYNTYSDDRVYRTAETGYQYPPDPAQNTSSVATGSWNSVYAPNVPSIEQSQSYQWSSTPQYQNQYQNQYQGQYQTEDSQAWPAGYYASPTYQTASSTEYDASNTYTGGDTSTQDYTQNEWDEAAHYE